MSDQFELEGEIARRVEDLGPAETPDEGARAVHLEALAILIDASLTPAERAEGFAQLLIPMLAQLGPDDTQNFYHLAIEQGEYAALVYLTEVTQRL